VGGAGLIVSYSATAPSKIIRMSATEMANSTTTTDAKKGNYRGQNTTQKKRIIKTATKQTELKATPKSVAGVKETKKCSIACLNGKTKAAIST